MRLINILMTVAAILITVTTVYSQTEKEVKDIQDILVKILDASEAEDYQAASLMFVYEGDDAARNLKDFYNSSVSAEGNKVKRLAKKIKAFQKLSESYSVGTVSKSSKSGVEAFVVEVIFNSGKQSLKTEFTFLSVKNSFGLLEVK
ncbi:MAG: hypothetical protein GXX85_14840 [Ignavibacteria bacterium]|nr:hypothetical protein [Ignavibacteria bacterium]